jgi:periplasmic protein TonB
MFEQTFVPEGGTRRKPVGIALSVIFQIVVLVLLATAPLLVRQPPPVAQLRLLFLGPRPSVPATSSTGPTTTTARTTLPRLRAFRLVAPIAIPKWTNAIVESFADAPDLQEMPGLYTGGDSLLSGADVLSNSAPPPAPKQSDEIKHAAGPLQVGGNVAAANLVRRVEPLYPALAKAARVQGSVVFQAVIGADGQIRNLQLQEGHPLLVEAARVAILQWRYRPTLLNSKPVEVVTTITVHFALSQ